MSSSSTVSEGDTRRRYDSLPDTLRNCRLGALRPLSTPLSVYPKTTTIISLLTVPDSRKLPPVLRRRTPRRRRPPFSGLPGLLLDFHELPLVVLHGRSRISSRRRPGGTTRPWRWR